MLGGGSIVWNWGSDISWQGVPTNAIAFVPVAIAVHSFIVLVRWTVLINWGLGVDASLNPFGGPIFIRFSVAIRWIFSNCGTCFRPWVMLTVQYIPGMAFPAHKCIN